MNLKSNLVFKKEKKCKPVDCKDSSSWLQDMTWPTPIVPRGC